MNIEKIIVITILTLMFVVIPCVKIFESKMESDTYNKLTGASTTWKDALWVELRVQDSSK